MSLDEKLETMVIAMADFGGCRADSIFRLSMLTALQSGYVINTRPSNASRLQLQAINRAIEKLNYAT